jgi:hypothetical protein
VVIVIAAVAIAVAVLLGLYLSWTAGRLDRLHNRTDAAWASLDAQLVRRAAVTVEIAHAATERALIKPDASERLALAAQTALEASGEERAGRENELGRALRAVLDQSTIMALAADAKVRPMLGALDAAMTKVVLARRFHATAVEDTIALRRGRAVRWFRLAGSARLPNYFDIDDTPVPLAISPEPRLR